MEFRPHPSSFIILAVWFCLPGALLCPFIFWQSITAGLIFALLWGGIALLLALSLSHTFRGSARAGVLTAGCGLLFKLSWRLPMRYITGITRLETPLQHLLHCCTLVVHTSGRALILPALSEAAAFQLVVCLHREGER